jgi:hypothetical protein
LLRIQSPESIAVSSESETEEPTPAPAVKVETEAAPAKAGNASEPRDDQGLERLLGLLNGQQRKAIAKYLHDRLGTDVALEDIPDECWRDNSTEPNGKISALKNLRNCLNKQEPPTFTLVIRKSRGGATAKLSKL